MAPPELETETFEDQLLIRAAIVQLQLVGPRAPEQADQAHIEPAARVVRVGALRLLVKERTEDALVVHRADERRDLRFVLQIDHQIILRVGRLFLSFPGQAPEIRRRSLEQRQVPLMRDPGDSAGESAHKGVVRTTSPEAFNFSISVSILVLD